jgi:hypothetical protein
VIFKHPLRLSKDGKPGMRTRKGLGTSDKTVAERLVEQVNTLLSDESYWKPSARARAAREMDDKVVRIFYDDIQGRSEDPWSRREAILPLPKHEHGYSVVLLVGPTGAGKTTVLRQFIGSHPVRDRFPSISTAKTTIFDMEIIMRPGSFEGVVSFLSRDIVRNYVEECVTAAIVAAAEQASEEEIWRKLMEHAEQRFRMSYLLGRPRSTGGLGADEEEDDFGDAGESKRIDEAEAAEIGPEEQKAMWARLEEFHRRVMTLAADLAQRVTSEVGSASTTMGQDEHDTIVELVEEEVQRNEQAQDLIDEIFEEIETRFGLLNSGSYEHDASGWPLTWHFKTNDRQEFIRTINRFSSNYAAHFGHLLAPLVEGMRIAGPFNPAWRDGEERCPPLVFIDGEGLGHTPSSATTLPTTVTKRYEIADVILLVDNATVPMQAAAQAVLESAAAGGHDGKLAIAFTHFDQVGGANLPDSQSRRDHVNASLDGAVAAVAEAVGEDAGRRLRRHLGNRVFFFERVQEELPAGAKRTRRQLEELIDLFKQAALPPGAVAVTPVYDLANLVLSVQVATEQFHERWNAVLGLEFKPGIQKEHWTRVKALSKRFAEQSADRYDSLMPVADLIKMLSDRLAAFISRPRDWRPAVATVDAKDAAAAKVARETYSQLHVLLKERLFRELLAAWGGAYGHRGTGSTVTRARDIRGIYETAAPVPGGTPDPEASRFLDVIRNMFREAALSAGAEVL